MTARKPAPVEERHRRAVAVAFLAEFLEPESPVMEWVKGSETVKPPFLPELAQTIADAERAGRVAGFKEGYAWTYENLEMRDASVGYDAWQEPDWKQADEDFEKRIRELEDGDGA